MVILPANAAQKRAITVNAMARSRPVRRFKLIMRDCRFRSVFMSSLVPGPPKLAPAPEELANPLTLARVNASDTNARSGALRNLIKYYVLRLYFRNLFVFLFDQIDTASDWG